MSRPFLIAAALAAGALSAAALAARPVKPALERAPTAEERQSFEEFFSARRAATPAGPWAARPLFAPMFEIDRDAGGKPWRVIARVDAAPRRSHPDLCRQIRSSFIYDATAPRGARWQEAAEPPRWYVWLATPNVPCAAARYTTLQDPKVAGADVVALLRQHRELLGRARLLFAGHSQCAPYRALTYRLAALEPLAPAAGAPQMLGMVFESDRRAVARVAVRKHGSEYTAWNVSCSG
ncbi:hypothetical protein ASF61_03795 [Duganella sp. Leaf126]|uniref:hypothetical protein n=1 Tax=Duganella sp. Leaf126 TaxID=1736266 RepID=UPI0006F2D62D|nr:hypothetical protein [Duganella sp. Leaf126]KQQ39946.1 hypothetical protein ASF61_03795 [Duganella sp. Leaf126]